MTNYNERLEEVLDRFGNGVIEAYLIAPKSRATADLSLESSLNEAQAAITSLNRELVAEAKPPVIDTPSRIKLYADDEGQMWYDRGQNDTIARFEQNLLKALGEK